MCQFTQTAITGLNVILKIRELFIVNQQIKIKTNEFKIKQNLSQLTTIAMTS